MRAVASRDRVRDDIGSGLNGAGAMPWCGRADVADTDAVDAPAGTERGDIDLAGQPVVVGGQTDRRGRRLGRRLGHGVDRRVLEKHEALDGFEAETFEARPGLSAEGTGANRVVSGASVVR